jgi:L-fuculose-phosphate aldolase
MCRLCNILFKRISGRNAVILANQDLLMGADCIENTFNIAEEIEYVVETFYRVKSIREPV